MAYFGANIKRIREEKKLTQKDVAEKMGISRQAYSRFEKLILPPKFDTIAKLADALSCKMKDLFSYELDWDSPINEDNSSPIFSNDLTDFEKILPSGYHIEENSSEGEIWLYYPDGSRIELDNTIITTILEDVEDLIVLKLERLRK